MRSRDFKFFDAAKSVARLSTWSELPREQTGSIIVLRNEIIATGYNRNRGNQLHGIFANRAGVPEAHVAHAETSALSKLTKIYGWSWSPAQKREFELMKIYVYRETNGGPAIARPCKICTLALKHFGISQIYYSTDDGYAEEIWE